MRLPEFRGLSGSENVTSSGLESQRGGCGFRGPNIHDFENLSGRGPVGVRCAGEYGAGGGPGVRDGGRAARALLRCGHAWRVNAVMAVSWCPLGHTTAEA